MSGEPGPRWAYLNEETRRRIYRVLSDRDVLFRMEKANNKLDPTVEPTTFFSALDDAIDVLKREAGDQ